MPPLDANAAESSEPLAAPTAEDDVRAVFEQLSRQPEPEAPEAAPEAETEEQREDRLRDERGRFARAEGVEPKAPDENAGAPAPAEGSKFEKLAPPEGWPADAKTQWDKLPRIAQEALAADLAAGKLTLGGTASAQDPVSSALRAYEDDARAVGADLATYAKTSLDWSRYIAAQPEAGLKALCKTLGVDPSRLTDAAASNVPGSSEATPEVATLQRELAEVRSQLNAMRTGSVQSEIDAWAAEADPQGNALRPHYGALDQTAFAYRVDLVRQQNPGLSRREILQRAYDAEVYAQPTVRALVLEAQRVADEAKRREAEGARAAEAARARSVSVRGSHAPTNTVTEAPPNETAEETVRRTMAAFRN